MIDHGHLMRCRIPKDINSMFHFTFRAGIEPASVTPGARGGDRIGSLPVKAQPSSRVIRELNRTRGMVCGLFAPITRLGLGLALLTVGPDAYAAVTIALLHTFNGADGQTPVGRLVEGSDGVFHGVTKEGGDGDCGTIFRITPTGDHTVLHSFSGAEDGCAPESGLTRGPETLETFYGVASSGGSSGVGTAYRITPDGGFETIHHFAFPGATPRAPHGRLLLGADGYFYGTSRGGGATPTAGSIFRMNTVGEVTVIHSFTGGAGGAFPHTGLTAGPDGAFYGTTLIGNSIYRVSPAGDFTTLHAITGGSSHPFDGPLILGPDDNLYGTVTQGGSAFSGLAYRISPGGVYTPFNFVGFDGSWVVAGPGGGLTLAADGDFYGSASSFYRMTTAGEITRLTDGGLPGGATAGAVAHGSDGDFYGVSRGITGVNRGWVFRVSGINVTSGAIRLTPPTVGEGVVSVIAIGPPGETVEIQRAPSPTGPWARIGNVEIGQDGAGDFDDMNPPTDGAFYRLRRD